MKFSVREYDRIGQLEGSLPISDTEVGVRVVARRWDGFGGRLTAILNAWAIARALDLEFRFVWPRGADLWSRDPSELFSHTFLNRFEITESVCAGPRLDLTGLSATKARELCRAGGGIMTSPSGLRWAHGWAYDPKNPQPYLTIGCTFRDGQVSAGVTFRPRPDVATSLNEPGARNCGFAIPLPLTVRDAAEVRESMFRPLDAIADTGRRHRTPGFLAALRHEAHQN